MNYKTCTENQLKLVGFNKEESIYDEKEMYFTKVVFSITGDYSLVKQYLSHDESLFDNVKHVMEA